MNEQIGEPHASGVGDVGKSIAAVFDRVTVMLSELWSNQMSKYGALSLI